MNQDKHQSLKEVTGIEYQRFLIKYARERLAADNFYDADFALQVCHSREANNPVLYNLRALLAHRMGLYEHALLYVNKSLEIQPDWDRAIQNQLLIRQALLKQDESNQQKCQQQGRESGCKNDEKYFLIHSWGSGLGFDLLYLLQQLLLAEMSNRTPVVHWGVNSVYNDHPHSDCFIDYFKPISKVNIDDLKSFLPDVYPDFWKHRPIEDHIRRTRWINRSNGQYYKIAGPYYLNRSEKVIVSGEFSSIKMLLPWMLESFRYAKLAKNSTATTDIYRDLIQRYIQPKKYLQNRAETFIENSFPNGHKKGKYIAVHLRGTDKHREKQARSLANVNAELISLLEKSSQQLPIFLMTDDKRQVQTMKKRFGERVFTIDVLRSTNDEKGVHLTSDKKKQMAEEVIVDMLVATQADHFYGCGFSYLACLISYMRRTNDSSTLLPFDLMTRFVDIPTVK